MNGTSTFLQACENLCGGLYFSIVGDDAYENVEWLIGDGFLSDKSKIPTKEQVLAAQDAWGNGIVAIGKRAQDAREFVNKMYVSGEHFKTTMAKEQPFRIEEYDDVSYFVGGCC